MEPRYRYFCKLSLSDSNRNPDGSYSAIISTPLNFVTESLEWAISLSTFSIDFTPRNFGGRDFECDIRELPDDLWRRFQVGQRISCTNINLACQIFNNRVPTGFKTKIKLSYNSQIGRVILKTSGTQIKFSENMCEYFGFIKDKLI